MVVGFNFSDFVNLIAFVSLTVTTYLIFYLGRALDTKKDVSFNIFTLSLGISLIGLSHLFRILFETASTPFVLVTVAAGSVFASVGVILVFYEKSLETINLKRRQNEINSIISNLKEKYYKQELSEDELKNAYSSLLEELAEIEVKLASKKRKFKTKL